MSGVGRRQTEGRERVCHDIGHGAEFFTAGRRKIHDAGQAVQHGLCVPTGHGHVFERFSRFGGAEFGACAHFLGLCGQGVQFGAGRAGNRRHLRHPRLKVRTNLDGIASHGSQGGGYSCKCRGGAFGQRGDPLLEPLAVYACIKFQVAVICHIKKHLPCVMQSRRLLATL